jgi:hypothetical protein
MELTNSAELIVQRNRDDQLIGDGMVFTGYKNRHIGAIRTIQLPHGWKVASTSFAHGGEWMLTTFAPLKNPKIELRIFCRGDKVTISDATYFSDLLKQASKEVIELKPEHILSLKNVLGPTVGDNQYVNQNPLNSRYAARCNLLKGRILNVQKRPVMMIEGLFTEGGIDLTKFLNVYINVNRGGQEVQEVFFQAPVLAYAQYYRQVRIALESIKWFD